jgi:drug/metabolite transporter (DMT)-like permease
MTSAAPPTAAARSPVVTAALWMLGALASFTAMALSIRGLSGHMGVFQILFWRSLVGLVVVPPLAMAVGGGLRSLASGQPRLQVLRNVVHFGGQFGWSAGLAVLPFATVFALEFTMPVFAAAIAVLVLGERMHAGRAAMIGLGFLGVLVVLRPGVAVFDPAALVVLAAALCYATTHAITKRLTRTDGPFAVLFWMSAVQLPLGLVPALSEWAAPTAADAVPILVLGLSGVAAHYCITRALQVADAMVVVPLDFLRLPLIAVVGWLAYGEPLDPFVLAGGAVIMAGIWTGIVVERRRGG